MRLQLKAIQQQLGQIKIKSYTITKKEVCLHLWHAQKIDRFGIVSDGFGLFTRGGIQKNTPFHKHGSASNSSTLTSIIYNSGQRSVRDVHQSTIYTNLQTHTVIDKVVCRGGITSDILHSLFWALQF